MSDDLWIPKCLRFNPVMDRIHDTLLGMVIIFAAFGFMVWSLCSLHTTLRELPFFQSWAQSIRHSVPSHLSTMSPIFAGIVTGFCGGSGTPVAFAIALTGVATAASKADNAIKTSRRAIMATWMVEYPLDVVLKL